MSRIEQLRHLENVMESFLEDVVCLKQDRLGVLDGLNSLDDIVRSSGEGFEITDRLGQWFAGHNRWLTEDILRPGDRDQIGSLLSDVAAGLDVSDESSPAVRKISSEIDRWDSARTSAGKESEKPTRGSRRIVLKRGAEEASPHQDESIVAFDETLIRCRSLLERTGHQRKHLFSAIDDSLKMASIQGNKDALLLSAFAIYYLKQNGYKTEPYVKRLKAAERLLGGGKSDA